jgi:hypothetical protein
MMYILENTEQSAKAHTKESTSDRPASRVPHQLVHVAPVEIALEHVAQGMFDVEGAVAVFVGRGRHSKVMATNA